MENYMIQLHENPGFIHHLAGMVTEFNLKQLDMLASAGIDVLVVEDDIAATNNLLISPRHFWNLSIPTIGNSSIAPMNLALRWCDTATAISGPSWTS